MATPMNVRVTAVEILIGSDVLRADLALPASPHGLIVFAHGSGSSRHSSRNKSVARIFQTQGLATLLADLLTLEEEAVDRVTADLRFNIDLLGRRLVGLIDWARARPDLRSLPLGLFGASTGAAAALVAAAARPADVAAVVSRGGRPDLAGSALSHVQAPTLLIVGGSDTSVLDLNRRAKLAMRCTTSLDVVPGATHLFEESGALDKVAALASGWFAQYLAAAREQLPGV